MGFVLSLLSGLIGLLVGWLVATSIRRSESARLLLRHAPVAKLGAIVLALAYALAALVPITLGLFADGHGDVGLVWCGTFLTRWTDGCDGCCSSNGAYGDRFTLLVWPAILGVGLIAASHARGPWRA